MSAEVVQLRVEVAALRNLLSKLRPLVPLLPPSDQEGLKDEFELFQ